MFDAEIYGLKTIAYDQDYKYKKTVSDEEYVCKKLIAAVMVNAYDDAVNVRPKLQYEARLALKFIDDKNDIFCLYCHMLEYDPTYLMERLVRSIKLKRVMNTHKWFNHLFVSNFKKLFKITGDAKMASKWIKGAIKHPGALHRTLGVPIDKKIPASKLSKAEHSKNPTTRKRAALAKTLKKISHK